MSIISEIALESNKNIHVNFEGGNLSVTIHEVARKGELLKMLIKQSNKLLPL